MSDIGPLCRPLAVAAQGPPAADGQGQSIADLVLPRMLHAVLVRSPVAHPRIRSVDLLRALAAPGVVLALSGADEGKMTDYIRPTFAAGHTRGGDNERRARRQGHRGEGP
jgi:CO/xanthine dehydrogenase Mo-binding subunit